MKTATRITHCLAADSAFEPLKEYVIAATGLAYYRSRGAELADRIARRLAGLDVTDCQSYLHLLQSGPAGDEELDCLIEDLTIGETYFFRQPELFAALEQSILPDVIDKNKRRRRLRIWSAGASIGAEAYSISILLRRHLAHLVRDWDITIIGTDINRSFLARAANAHFEEWALRGLTPDIKYQCFLRRGQYWMLYPKFRNGVSFQYHNLVEHPFPSLLHNLFAFDVILCRNVMIYFNYDVIERLVSNMRRCLVDGGWLLVGHAEHRLGLFREFHTVTFTGATAYQQVDGLNDMTVRPLLRDTSYGMSREEAPKRADASSKPQAARPPRVSPKAPVPQKQMPRRELEDIRMLADRGQLEAADSRCRQLLAKHKLDPACHLYHALILEHFGQHSSCIRALRRAIYLDRNFVLAHYYLGLALMRSGHRTQGAQSLSNARRLLRKLEPDHLIEDSDGLTAAGMDELARMQLETVEP